MKIKDKIFFYKEQQCQAAGGEGTHIKCAGVHTVHKNH